MHLIDAPGHSANQFVNGNPQLGIDGTDCDAAWLNMVQNELVNLLAILGVAPIKGTNNQLAGALVTYIKGYITNFVGLELFFTGSGTLTAGQVLLLNDTVGIVAFTTSGAVANALYTRGRWTVPKKSTDVMAPGHAVYWDNANGYVTLTSAGNRLIGAANESKGSGETSIQIILRGAPNPVS